MSASTVGLRQCATVSARQLYGHTAPTAAQTTVRLLNTAAATAAAAASLPRSSALAVPPASLRLPSSLRSSSHRRSMHASAQGLSASAAAGSRAGAKFENPYANARAPNEAELKILASTVPVLAQHGLTLTTRFYTKVFSNYPQLKNIFNQAHQATGMQPKALADAVYAYAANITNLGALGSAVAHMAHKHASLSILPEHYPIVGTNLLSTLDELLTEAGFERKAIDDIISAWTVAYAQLANILISAEENLYQAAEAAPGGWRGWRKFEVVERVEETAPAGSNGEASNVGPIVSFTLKPKDGGLVPAYLPGQYTTVLASTPAGFTQPRQYSLSKAADNKSFRITVKREDPLPSAAKASGCPMSGKVAPAPESGAAPAKAQCPFTAGGKAKQAHGSVQGVVSTLLHSSLQVGAEVDLAPPFGEFVLQAGQGPVVLLAAGVGITPLVPMLETAASEGRKVALLYATQSGNKHPLRSWFAGYRATGAKVIDAAATATPNAKPTTVQGSGSNDVTLKVWYESPVVNTDTLGVTHDYTGRIELDKLSTAEQEALLALQSKDATYYVCGPTAFMSAQLSQLRKLGVPDSRLHAEVFGSGGL